MDFWELFALAKSVSGNKGGSSVLKRDITLSTTWSGNGPYTQTVTIQDTAISANSKIDLQPDATALAQLLEDGVSALFISNSNGTLTATAIGGAPSAALTIQCTITEVAE